jgi:serine/threonine-protein kinase
MSVELFGPGIQIKERYELTEFLGKGGMGQVWKAKDTALDSRPVAIKFIAQEMWDDEEKRERFRLEMQALARLDHPNIVQLLEFGKTPDGPPFLVMNFIPGASLQTRLEEGQLDTDTRDQVLKELCDALDYIHDQNVVHRDLKPSNILSDASGHVRISDFGLAKLLDDTDAASVMGGTFGFMAPEQGAEAFKAAFGRGETPRIDHRADIYALGVIAWLLFTGQHPDSPVALPPDLLSPELERALRKALARNREDRYNSAGEFFEAITLAISPPLPDTSLPAPRRRLSLWVWGGMGAVVVLLLTVGIASLLGGGSGDGGASDATSTAFALLSLSPSTPPTATPTHVPTPTATTMPATPTETPSPTPTSSATPTATTTPSPTPSARVVAAQLTVRAGPGENYQILGEVRRGYQLPLLGRSEDGTWWQVDYLGWAGWIPAQAGEASIAPNDLTVIPTPPPTTNFFTLTDTPTPTATPTPTPTPEPTSPELRNPGFERIASNVIPGWQWRASDNFISDQDYDPDTTFITPLFKQADDPVRFITGPTLQIDGIAFIKFRAYVFQTVSVTPNASMYFQAWAGAYADEERSIGVAVGIDPNGGPDCRSARRGETLPINQRDGAVRLVSPEIVAGPDGRVTVCLYAESLTTVPASHAAFFDDAELIPTLE